MAQARLADFSRGHGPASVPLSSRVTAAALTVALYGLVFFIGTQHTRVPRRPPPAEIVAKLVMVPAIRDLPVPPKIPVRLVKPPAQTPSPPVFVVAAETSPPQATVPPTDTQSPSLKSGPLASGAPFGSGNGQGGTANGISGTALSGCYDAQWAQAVSNHIAKFLFYPDSEKRRHVTGLVFVDIGIRRNGRLAFSKVGKSSRVRALDQAALETVRQAAPLPRIPERMHVDRVDVEVPIFFGPPDKSLNPSPGNCLVDGNIIFHRDT